jgi:predicted transcriptional regulator YdeE
MQPVRFEEKELLLAGCLVKYDGGNEWAEWEEKDSKAEKDPRYAHHHLINGSQAHSVWFFPENGAYVFTGLEVTRKTDDTAWEYLEFPPVTYAVFELDYKTDTEPQTNAIWEWIDERKDKTHRRIKWNADGRLELTDFEIYIYDHSGKFGENKIVELWIPFENL